MDTRGRTLAIAGGCGFVLALIGGLCVVGFFLGRAASSPAEPRAAAEAPPVEYREIGRGAGRNPFVSILVPRTSFERVVDLAHYLHARKPMQRYRITMKDEISLDGCLVQETLHNDRKRWSLDCSDAEPWRRPLVWLEP